MTSHNGQKPLQPLSSTLDDFVREAVSKDFAWKRWNINAGGFMLEDITKGLKIGVAATDDGMTEFECRDISL